MTDARRLVIFFLITFAILFLTNLLYKPPAKKVEQPKPDTVVVVKEVAPVESVTKITEAVAEKEIVIDEENYRAVFSNQGGGLKSLYLKKFDAELVPEGEYLFSNIVGGKDLARAGFESRRTGNEITFTKKIDGVTIKKQYIFDHPYGFQFNVVTEPANVLLTNSLEAGLAITEPKNKADDIRHFHLYVKRQEVQDLTGKIKDGYTYSKNPEWIGLRTKYFFLALVNNDQLDSLKLTRLGDKRIGLNILSTAVSKFNVYFLPIKYDLLQEFDKKFEDIARGGIFGPISRFFLTVLKLFNRLFKNYGWSIILFGLIVKVIFYPLSFRMIKTQKKMQMIQPEIQKIQKKYKDKPAEMNREVMAMYRAYKVNPLGGCLPLLIQMPIFFALYSTLTISIELRRAPFLLWITDLSLRDPYFVLPIAMGVLSIVQSLFTITDPRQKLMVILMPVFMTYIFLFLPSGLQLYWFIYNVFSIIEQFVVKRYGGLK